MTDKQIVLVGNGPSVLNQQNGKLIDSYDTIMRFNFYHIKKYEQYVGTRTDMWWTTVYDKQRLEESKCCEIIEHSWEWNPIKDKTFKKISDFLGYKPRKTEKSIIKEMQEIDINKTYHCYSSGVIALYMLSKEYDEISITGFDWWENNLQPKDNHHYADNYKVGNNHKPHRELAFIKQLAKQCNIFNINTNTYIKHDSQTK